MGLLRFILALSVVLAHLGYEVFVSGRLAVQLFFVISGYLIAYALMNNYDKISSFYCNRFLRLYPTYIFVAFTTFLIFLFLGNYTFFSTYRELDVIGQGILIFSNILIFGQDLVMFLTHNENETRLALNFWESDPVLFRGLLIIPAWSLGVECLFYLIIPFVIRHNKWLILFFLFSVSVRILTLHLEFGMKDPWNYRFFPSELSVFLLGVFSYKFLNGFFDKFAGREKLNSILLTGIVTVLCITYSQFNVGAVSHLSMIIGICIALPALFSLGRHWAIDKYFASLSYPMYLWHMTVIHVVKRDNWVFDAEPKTIFFIALSISGTLAASIVTVYVIENPIQNLRAKNRQKKVL